MNLWIVVFLVFVLNLPCGWWRAGLEKFSWQWFVAIHAPVPLVVALRLWTDLHWKVIPVLAFAFFAGQFLGVRLGRRLHAGRTAPD